jgi:hypothetical protein
MSVEQIERADMAEFHAAILALKAAKSTEELAAVWFRDCDRWEGDQRDALRRIYTSMLFKCGALQP